MVCREQDWTTTQTQLLMDISATLADYTQKLELCREIPDYLSRTLNLEPLTVAVVREVPDGSPQIVLSSSSGAVVPEEAASTFEQTLLEMYRQVRPQAPSENGTPRIGFSASDTHGVAAEITVDRLAAYRNATVFVRTVDAQHRMLLIVHQSVEAHGLRADQAELLHLVSDQLAKLCACLMIWAARPAELGAPFSRLTDR